MKIPKTLIYAPGFEKQEIHEAASEWYMGKIMALRVKYDHLIKPGTVVSCDVAHDSHCRLQNGGNGCNCDPDVSLTINGVTYAK